MAESLSMLEHTNPSTGKVLAYVMRCPECRYSAARGWPRLPADDDEAYWMDSCDKAVRMSMRVHLEKHGWTGTKAKQSVGM